MSKVTLKNLSKTFGDVEAVQNLNLEIRQGDFFSLLGPSGCGKTTTLRMIAGFEFPTSGQIFFGEGEVTFLKPNLRNAGMVFQNFALFPHMTVFENVAFGLQARKVGKIEIRERVGKALELVELSGFESRKVTELSGGQQQRVALVRAIVIDPEILLLDEPLSNLDAKLREETREEIKTLQNRLGITTIYVTHDQEEALALSDKIAVMNHGICQQVGSPTEIYQRPQNEFVAGFVGNSNIIKAKIIRTGEETNQVEIAGDWMLEVQNDPGAKFSQGQKITLGVRPENIRILSGTSEGPNIFEGSVRKMKFSGAVIDYEIEVKNQHLRVRSSPGESGFIPSDNGKVFLQVHRSKVQILS